MEEWSPDAGLVDKVRTIGCPIKGLSDDDRVWVVVSLLTSGLTAQAVADRMDCSLRLIRNIRADPRAPMALHALELSRALRAEQAVRLLESRLAAQRLSEALAELERLRRQRSELVRQLQLERSLVRINNGIPPIKAAS